MCLGCPGRHLYCGFQIWSKVCAEFLKGAGSSPFVLQHDAAHQQLHHDSSLINARCKQQALLLHCQAHRYIPLKAGSSLQAAFIQLNPCKNCRGGCLRARKPCLDGSMLCDAFACFCLCEHFTARCKFGSNANSALCATTCCLINTRNCPMMPYFSLVAV